MAASAMRTAKQAAAEVEGRTKPKATPNVQGKERDPKKVNALKVMGTLVDGLLPDQRYIQEGLRAGTITRQPIGMKHIVVDTSLQARIPQADTGKHFSMDHVRKLAAIRDADDGKPLAPIVVFFDRKTKKYYIADGFHRHEENRLRKCGDIVAYVVDVEDWRHEAILFAAMCNQEMCLPRKPEDIRKAAEMMFADPECWNWSDSRIGNHCKLSGGTVQKYRREYQKINGLDIPKTVKASDGRVVPYSKSSHGALDIRPKRSETGKTVFYTNFLGKSKYLGSTEEAAKRKIEQIKTEQEKIDLSRKSLVKQNLYDILLRRGVSLKFFDLDSSYRGIASGLYGRGVIVIPDQMIDRNETVKNIGSLYLLNKIIQVSENRLVICCYVEDALPSVASLARQCGVEFLTPDELIESLKSDQDKETP